ncbi:MAG TPA: hypothetical protein VGI67_11630 [Thermoleophilaceae bacterium]|jgi:hypothetical protein
MFSATSYIIREATEKDAPAIRQLASINGARPLEGEILIGEIAGRPAAAISLDDERVVADAFGIFLGLSAQLRMRARAVQAHRQTPSLRKRMLIGVGALGAEAA